MLKTIKKSFLAVVLAVATLFALTSCVITGGGQTTTDPTLDAQAALSEFTEQVTFADTGAVTTSFNLPAAGKKGSYQIPITWTSNNEAVIAITDLVEGGTTSATHKKANVTRPIVGAEDVTVTLTAEFSLTYTKNDGTSATLKETKTYNFTVLAKTADADAPDDVDGLEVGVPYKLGMYQEAEEKTLYALNAMSGFYGASTETLEDADDVYVEEATNGYYIYFLDGTTKTYISCAYELGSDGVNHFNYKLTSTASTVWAYDATAQKLTTVIEETELVLGTKSSYQTFSADEENIYFAHFYESPTASMSEDEKKVAADVKALEIATTVTENITLPATGANGSTITWESSNTAVIAADGTVIRGAEDVVVTLTATIKSGEASEVVEFEVKVVGNNSGSVIELTVDSLGIENGKYLAGTPTVGGIGFEYIQLGNYGNGIQMRDKDGNTSKLWSTTALGTGIVKIELVFNSVKSTYDNQNAVIFSFGNAVDNLTYTTKLTTVAGTKTYTITPDANTYTYLYIEHDIEYSFYWDSIKIYYNAGTSGETPEQPAHTHTKCDVCGLCTSANCDGADTEKCAGHPIEEPAVTNKTVAELIALTTEMDAKYTVTGKVVLWGNKFTSTDVAPTQYGNFVLEGEDGSKIVVYGATATASALTFNTTTGKYTYVNAKDFTTNELTSTIAVGDTVELVVVRTSYNSNPQLSAIVTKVTKAEPEVPAHEHTLCEVCQKCTAADCDGADTDKCQGHTTEPETPEQPVVSGGRADLETIDPQVTTGNITGGYGQYNKELTSTNGWTSVNSALLVGGTADNNPVFIFIGADNTTKAVTINGKTVAKGVLTSPTLTGGISKLTFNYGHAFSESNGININVTITDASGNKTILNLVKTAAEVTQKTAYTAEFVLETPVLGDFTIEFTNNSPSQNEKSNKDRVSLWNIEWVGATGSDAPVEPEQPTHTHTKCDVCGLCTAEDCDGAEEVKCQGHEPEVPAHEHTACPTCGLCTAEDCDGAEEVKCQGHVVEPTYLTVEEVKALTKGATASVKGVVIAKGTESLLIQDETGAIMLYKANNQALFGETKVGDVVTAEGVYSPFNGLHEVANLTSLAIAETGTAPAVTVLTAIDAATIESLQCKIVSIELTYVSGTVAAKSSATFKDANGTTITVYGDSKWGTVETLNLVPGTIVKVTGFVNWYNGAQLTNVSGYTFVEVLSVPAHEHTACPTCGLCTAEDCDGTDEVKCQGHVAEPENPAETKTYAHTFAKDQLVKAGGQATLSGINWTSSAVGYLGWDTNSTAKGIQFGSKNNPAGTFTLKTNEISGKISKIVVNGSVGSGGDGKLTVTVNGTQVGSTISLTTTATDYTFDVSDLSGEIVITFSNTAKAMYIKSVSVTYTE